MAYRTDGIKTKQQFLNGTKKLSDELRKISQNNRMPKF